MLFMLSRPIEISKATLSMTWTSPWLGLTGHYRTLVIFREDTLSIDWWSPVGCSQLSHPARTSAYVMGLPLLHLSFFHAPHTPKSALEG